MRFQKQLSISVCAALVYLITLSIPQIVQGQIEAKSKQSSFEETCPYTIQVEKPKPASGYELSQWSISITVQIDGTLQSQSGDKLKLVLYDKTEKKEEESTTSSGQFCVASLATTGLDTKHEYEIRISSTPSGRGIQGSWLLTWVETEKTLGGGGIPGFPYESIILGITVGILLLWWMRRRT